MMLVFLLGLEGTLALQTLLQDRRAAPGWLGMVSLQEPYEDLSLLVLFCIGAIALIWLVSGWSLRHLASASREAAVVGPSNPGHAFRRGVCRVRSVLWWTR
jgi:hypothetical protein